MKKQTATFSQIEDEFMQWLDTESEHKNIEFGGSSYEPSIYLKMLDEEQFGIEFEKWYEKKGWKISENKFEYFFVRFVDLENEERLL